MSYLDALGVYRPGTTPLHRAPVGAKVAGLFVLSTVIVVVHGPAWGAGFLALAVVVALVGRVPLRSTVRGLRPVLVFAIVVAAFQWWWTGPTRAAESLLDLLALGLLALTLSVTTSTTAMLDAFTRWISPLRPLGVSPERVALTIGLAISSIPGTVQLALETRDAARARGLERSPRAYLTPFVIRVVAKAHETGDALQARGLGD